jgi:serine/threonine-protein kinase
MVDARSDVWSLGVVLHELVTGAPPFDGESAGAVYAAVVAEEPVRLSAKAPDAPAALEAVVLRCLEKDPSKRWPSVDALAAALTQVLRGDVAVVAANSETVPPKQITTARRAPVRAIALVCITLIAATVAVVLALRR